MSETISGQCLCGAVRLAMPRPDYITECNCTACTKTGGRWGYHPGEMVAIEGDTAGYVRKEIIEPYLSLHHCPQCGCTTHWEPLTAPPHERMGVNVRLFEESDLTGIEVRPCDGRSWPL